MASIYAQSYKAKEVIVVDDGSTDASSNIKKEFPDIRYIYQENSGVSSARNLGIKNAKYEWIAFLDSDDEWHKDKLKEHLSLHKTDINLLISYTDEKWIRNEKEVKVPKKFHKFSGDIFKKCLSHCIIAPSATLLHKDLLEDVGLFDEDLEVCEDYDLWLRISSRYKIDLIDKKLITKYGGDKDQLSMKFWGMDRFRVKALEKLLSIEPKTYSNLKDIKDELIKKYTLLLKGAKKYDRVDEINIYERRLEELNFSD